MRRLQRRTDELRQLLQVSREREQAQRQEQQDRMEDTENAHPAAPGRHPSASRIQTATASSGLVYQRARRLRRHPVIEERLDITINAWPCWKAAKVSGGFDPG